jgi:hypothetical protein
MEQGMRIQFRAEAILAATMLCMLGSGCAPEATSAPQPGVPAQPAIPTGGGADAGSIAANDEPAPQLEAGSPSEPARDEPPPAAFYTVGHYDKQQDPAADLAATIERATAERKRIILQIGGDWCVWCGRISRYMETNERVRQLVEDHFVVMKVTDPGENAESFLSRYPRVNAYPHFFVLETDGTFLHSQGTGELEHEQSYDEEVFCKFLNDWAL